MDSLITGHDRRWKDLAEMCDYGASRVKDGTADAVRFDVWPTEAEDVKAYMAKAHPGVPYQISFPRFESKEAKSDG